MRVFARIVVCCLFATLPSAAGAQSYPDRPIRMIVSIAAGSVTDVIMRAAAAELGPRLGQQLVIENRGGASGIPAAQQCAQAAPDGYTVCVIYHSTLAFNPLLFNKLPYDPDKDFALDRAAVLLDRRHRGHDRRSRREIGRRAQGAGDGEAERAQLRDARAGLLSRPVPEVAQQPVGHQHRRDSVPRRRSHRPGAGGRRIADGQYGPRQLHAAARERQDQAGCRSARRNACRRCRT